MKDLAKAQALWEYFCDVGSAHGSTDNGAIDLYDIDGMFEAARALFDALVATIEAKP